MNAQLDQWSSDVWSAASGFLARFTDLMEDLRYSEDRHLPVLNPSGRFQDLTLRQLQSLVHQVEQALDSEDEESFLSASIDLLDFSETMEVETSGFRSELEIVEGLFVVVEPEMLYGDKPDREQGRIITLCQDALIDAIKKDPSLLYGIDPRAFEELVADIFFRNGFEVELTAATRDGGKDIIAIKRGFGVPVKHLIECKRYKQDHKVSLDIVQRLYGVLCSDRASTGLVVTTSTFTKDALEFASQHPWELALRDHGHLIDWIRAIPNSSLNADRFRRYGLQHSAT